jgi:tetratricopeptide (TPR) repeat protein
MSQKKDAGTQLSQEDHQQIQDLFSRYHQIAEQLHTSTDQTQAEATLADIMALPTAVQLVLLKMLASEKNTDAADILTAIYMLDKHKDIRKEARRGLIRLEAAKTYSRWKPPIVHAPAVQLQQSEEPRFWKGLVTQSRDQGEIQLILCWEQGYNYSEVRVITFILNYWETGIKEVTSDTLSKRRLEQIIEKRRADLPDEIALVDCTLAEGKRLIEEALSVNQWQGKAPDKTYRQQLPLINKLIFQAIDLGEDRGHTLITPDLEEPEVIVNFLGAWVFGDYGLAYDFLTDDSNLRDGLSRDEWIKLHRTWHQEAHPTRMKLGFVHEHEAAQSALWLPSSVSLQTPSHKHIEVGWSLELSDTPLSGTLKDMPLGTAVNKETGRHWFWIGYTLVHEEGVWRIQGATDKGLALQGLSIHELQSRIEEHQKVINKLTEQHPDTEQAMEEVSWRLRQILHFYDALIIRLPLDYQIYEAAYAHSILLGDPEHVIVYLELMVQRFEEKRAHNLSQLGATLAGLAYNYDPQKMPERFNHLLQLAEETLRKSIAIDNNNLIGYIALAELLLQKGDYEEAEAEFYKALKRNPGPDEQTAIETGLGHVALQRDQVSEAITHFKHVVESNPLYHGAWFRLGFAHRQLGNFEDAEQCYQQAIEVEPHDIRSYSELTAIYLNRGQSVQAQAIIEQAIQLNPTSAHLHALRASVLLEQGDRRGAQQELQEAEQINPELEMVQKVRQYLYSSKRK